MANGTVDVLDRQVTEEELARALELLDREKKHKARVEAGEIKGNTWKTVAQMTPEELEKYRASNARYSAKNQILLRKARQAGITVTEEEVNEYLAAAV